MRSYTKIPNEILGPSHLTIEARYLYCLLLKYCGRDERCFPSQDTLAKDTGFTSRHIRNLLNHLILAGIVVKKRSGWNRANTYTVSKLLKIDRNGISYHLGSMFPLQQGNELPPKSTYLKGKGKRSSKGLESLREALIKRGILK